MDQVMEESFSDQLHGKALLCLLALSPPVGDSQAIFFCFKASSLLRKTTALFLAMTSLCLLMDPSL